MKRQRKVVNQAYTGKVTDWIADPELTREEKLARFNALGPELTSGPSPEAQARFEVYRLPAQGWHFRLLTAGGDVVFTSDAYATKEAAIEAIEKVARLAGQATLAVA